MMELARLALCALAFVGKVLKVWLEMWFIYWKLVYIIVEKLIGRFSVFAQPLYLNFMFYRYRLNITDDILEMQFSIIDYNTDQKGLAIHTLPLLANW